LYVRPMEKHELAFVTSTCTMSCNVLLHDCTRHIITKKHAEGAQGVIVILTFNYMFSYLYSF
jgi:hypothetical protein